MRRTAILSSLLPAVFVLTCPQPCAHASGFQFPADPSDEYVIDRAFERTGFEEDQLLVYATLFDRDGRASVDVQLGTHEMSGLKWYLAYTWNIEFMDDPVLIPEIAVVDIWSDGELVRVTYQDHLATGEGIASLYLELDLATMEFTESWVD